MKDVPAILLDRGYREAAYRWERLANELENSDPEGFEEAMSIADHYRKRAEDVLKPIPK